MPIGYWWTVALVSWGVVCALTRWRRLGSFSAIPALLASELPFIVGYLLIRRLTSRRGFVCVSANYRLQPRVTLADQVADVRDAIAWVRVHAADYGAQSGTLYVTGSSAGANLAIRAVCEGETGIAGLICRYGYYGDLAPRGDIPPMLVVHGEKDMLIPVADARAFVERVRAVSSRPVIYAELPGAHHDFDMYESIRSAAVNQAVEQFTARVSTSPM